MKIKLFLLSIILCSSSIFARKPKWVKERPILPDYYQGIGVADKKLSPSDYQIVARGRALKELSSEITVTVSANSLLHQFENNNDIRESYESSTSLKTNQTLQGYDLETYETDDFYYVYAKLSKEKYELEKDRRLTNAKRLALINYQKGLSLLKNNEPVAALSNFLKVIAQLKDHLDEDLVIRDIDGSVNLGGDTYSNIQMVLQHIRLIPDQPDVAVKFYKVPDTPLTITAVFKGGSNGDTPCVDLPICYSFLKGEGILTPVGVTDYEGRSSCIISKFSSNGRRQQIVARLNINALLDTDPVNAKIQKAFLPTTALPETTINLEMIRQKAFCVVQERNLVNSDGAELLANTIRSNLNQNFFIFTDSLAEADYKIVLSISFTQGDVKPANGYTVYIAFCDVQIRIIDLKTKEEIFSDYMKGVKGMRSGSLDHAIKDAAAKCYDVYSRDIVPKLERLDM